MAKIWGFLKYHHPAVAAAERQWDNDLLTFLPRVLAAPTADAANDAISEWIAALGPVPDCAPCATEPENLQQVPNLDWLSDEALLGPQLSSILRGIYSNRPRRANFYVAFPPGSPNPSFRNEPDYPALNFPDAGYQLLALFRFWNAIEYYYPHREAMADRPDRHAGYWDDVLREFIPAFVSANTREQLQQQLMQLAARVHDTSTTLLDAAAIRPPTGPCQFTSGIRFFDGRAIVTQYLTPDGNRVHNLTIGREIDALDEIPLKDLLHQWMPYYPASNESAMLRDIAQYMTRGPCGFSGDTRVSTSAVNPAATLAHDRAGLAFQMLYPDVAYLKLSAASASQLPAYIRSAAAAKGLIIDLRNVSVGSFAATLAGHLVATPVEFARYANVDPATPGAFVWGATLRVTPQEPRYSGQVFILVDELTQGSGEMAAMALQAVPNALLVGSTTASAAGPVSILPLPGGLRASIRGAGVFYPNTAPTHPFGILPHVEIKPSAAVALRNRDAWMEEAVTRITGRAYPGMPTGPEIADLGGGVGMQFVNINPGEFMMGCSPGDTACASAEKPAHLVRITKTFQMAKYEVRQCEWQAVLASNPARQIAANLPAAPLTWLMTRPFLVALNARSDGYRYRLPTEAEWEYAARAGTTGSAYGKLSDIAWFNIGTLHSVGEKLPNAWSLYDMLGNVAEMVEDFYSRYSEHPAVSPLVDPQGVSTSWPDTGKVVRGGDIYSRDLRVSRRSGYTPQLFAGPVGFGVRVLRERLDTPATPRLNEFVVFASTLTSGGTVLATVNLTPPALDGGARITLTSSDPALTDFPAGITVPAGLKEADFYFAASTVAATRPLTFTATLGGDVRTVALKIIPSPTSNAGPLDMSFVEIPPGEFIQGCSFRSLCGSAPRALVRITKKMEMAKHEVTQAQWQALMGSNPSEVQGATLPVTHFSWDQAQEFLAKLSALNDGYRYRLPTAAEWEYSARAGTSDQYAGGIPAETTWRNETSPKPVGLKKPNAWGLFDTIGNVHELVQDWAGPLPYSFTPLVDPAGPASGPFRSVRGGSVATAGPVVHYETVFSLSVQPIGLRCARERVAP
ncbi:MAG: SUMF1/EgtB/PvdO family nonheme iron enzyme [Acidobacteria bacterium]|nr:SUMF1/EgtB/PvdO family nonheme iron enzyme [Acidobacteriota bacterium]